MEEEDMSHLWLEVLRKASVKIVAKLSEIRQDYPQNTSPQFHWYIKMVI
jgi:hypothetical protein